MGNPLTYSAESPPLVPEQYSIYGVQNKIALFTQSGIVGDSRPAPKSKPPRPERIHQSRWLFDSPNLGPMNLLRPSFHSGFWDFVWPLLAASLTGFESG